MIDLNIFYQPAFDRKKFLTSKRVFYYLIPEKVLLWSSQILLPKTLTKLNANFPFFFSLSSLLNQFTQNQFLFANSVTFLRWLTLAYRTHWLLLSSTEAFCARVKRTELQPKWHWNDIASISCSTRLQP